MKNRVNILTILCCIALLVSCSKMAHEEEEPSATETVNIQIGIPSTGTKAGGSTDQGTPAENYIGVTQIVFFAANDDKTGVVERVITFDPATPSEDGQFVWDAETNILSIRNVDTGRSKSVCVVANATTANGYDVAAIKVGETTEADLLKFITESTTLGNPTVGKGMLMSGMVRRHNFVDHNTMPVDLTRQLVKIKLTVNLNKTFVGLFPAISFDGDELSGDSFFNVYNIPNQSFVHSATPASAPVESGMNDFMKLTSLEKSETGANAQWTTEIYTYENPVSGFSSQSKDSSTWFVLNLPYKNGGVVSIRNYYKFYINDNLDSTHPHKTIRNHIYDLVVTVNGFGGLTPNDGRSVDVATTVLKWKKVDVNKQTGHVVTLSKVTDGDGQVIADKSSLSEDGTTLAVSCNTNIGGWYTVTRNAQGKIINRSSPTDYVSADEEQTISITIPKLAGGYLNYAQNYTVSIHQPAIAMETDGPVKLLSFTQRSGFIPNSVLKAAGWPDAQLPAEGGLQIAKRGNKMQLSGVAEDDDPTVIWKTLRSTTVGTAPGLGYGGGSTGAMEGTIHPAAQYCRDMGKGWFLPSKEELLLIYNNQSLLGSSYSFTEHSYWSATEKDSETGWLVTFPTNSSTDYSNKDKSNRVRCVKGTIIPRGSYIPRAVLETAGWPADRLPAIGLQIAVRGHLKQPGEAPGSYDSAACWNEYDERSGAEATGLGVGVKNTALMLAFGAIHPVAYYCRQMGLEWYLPSKDELMLIGKNHSLLGASYSYVEGARYSSSSATKDKYGGEYSEIWAVWMNNSTSGLHESQKRTFSPYRCVREI